ncbi:MAG: DedA family protein [Deltaproteobacteria bacterium]|nr:DedA family protein [Deltaproteobacteria bacterium]
MDYLKLLFDIFLHLDKYLDKALQLFGGWTYLVLFMVVFCETGLVVTPFLPGDSLLFATGAFAAKGSFVLEGALTPASSALALFGLISVAAIVGDTVNYWIGRKVGPKIFSRNDVRFLNKKHLERTHAFYERHGGKTIILARFVPIIRTFAPFVAGIGQMSYWRFISYNVIGGIAWVGICIGAGYALANNEWVQKNFSVVIIAIVLISVIPAAVEFLRGWFQERKAKNGPAAA